ncbi:MAG: tetratricopeptide repeat protein, partial [Acidobacteria bacterium]|nr:tetratricopeptide repeat protein [Acidobacteriota bacterium]
GGIGKTALLTHAINRLRPRFKDVMSFDCRRAALAPETILLELHRYFAAQGKPQLQSLIGQNVPPETLADEIAKLLTEWPLLVVFDNFESQLDERRAFLNEDLRIFLAKLLRVTATGSRFLFTTRVLFDLDCERLGNVQELPLGDLSRAEALMLMQKLPNLAQATHRHKLAVLEKFGGHPYALVMLDRYCSHQPLDQALQDASSLESELREHLAIELNYRRLPEQARELLNRLAAFRTQVPEAAVEWVLGQPLVLEKIIRKHWDKFSPEIQALGAAKVQEAMAEVEVRRTKTTERERQVLLRELVSLGFVFFNLGSARIKSLSLHCLVREFCQTQLACEEWRQHLSSAAKYYANQARLIDGSEKSEALVWEELKAVDLWMEAEAYGEAAWLLADAHPLLERWGFAGYVEGQYLRLTKHLQGRELAAVLHNRAAIRQEQGDYDQALSLYQHAQRISEQLGDASDLAKVQHQIAVIHQYRREYDEALREYEASLAYKRQQHDRTGMAITLYQLGTIHHEKGRYDKALAQFRESLTLFEQLAQSQKKAAVIHQIGMVYHERGEEEEALAYYQRAMVIREELCDLSGQAHSLHNLGALHYQRKEYEAALDCYQRSLSLREKLGERPGVAALFHQIGMVHQALGQHQEAWRLYGQALSLKLKIGDPAEIALTRGQVGEFLTECGQYDKAFQYLLKALLTYVELQSPKASIVGNMLRHLREQWGAANFDTTWQNRTGQVPPHWLQTRKTQETLR